MWQLLQLLQLQHRLRMLIVRKMPRLQRQQRLYLWLEGRTRGLLRSLRVARGCGSTLQAAKARCVCEDFSYKCMRPSATSVGGLQLLVYAAFSF